jgi:hypothetical protein
MEGDMHSGLRLIALSTALAVSAGSGVAADVKCDTADATTHRESGFHFYDVAKSHKWRVSVGSPSACNQVLYSFLAPTDPANKSGNDFTAELPKTFVKVPGCDSPGPPQAVVTGGQIEVYCSVRDGGATTSRWASIVIWIKSPGYYGAAYSVITANQSPNSDPPYTGIGVDPMTQDLAVRVNMQTEAP